MNEIIRTLEAISNTLGTIKTDNTDGNWSKLLGCQNACRNLITALNQKKEETADGNHD